MGYGYSVASGARTVMGEPYDGLESYSDYENESDARWDYQDAWDFWKRDALSCLSDRWTVEDGETYRDGHPSGRVIARSGLHELLLDECQGGYGYAYLSVVPREDLPESGDTYYGYEPEVARKAALARASLDMVADSIFDRLAKLQEIRVPGGYVSSAYKPRRAA